MAHYDNTDYLLQTCYHVYIAKCPGHAPVPCHSVRVSNLLQAVLRILISKAMIHDSDHSENTKNSPVNHAYMVSRPCFES